jgi:hypothetical protein
MPTADRKYLSRQGARAYVASNLTVLQSVKSYAVYSYLCQESYMI